MYSVAWDSMVHRGEPVVGSAVVLWIVIHPYLDSPYYLRPGPKPEAEPMLWDVRDCPWACPRHVQGMYTSPSPSLRMNQSPSPSPSPSPSIPTATWSGMSKACPGHVPHGPRARAEPEKKSEPRPAAGLCLSLSPSIGPGSISSSHMVRDVRACPRHSQGMYTPLHTLVYGLTVRPIS